MIRHLRPALVLFLLMSLLLGAVYPAAVWLIGKTVFPYSSIGSFITDRGRVRGSELIGQHFASASYFWARPSATPSGPYQFLGANASNLNPANPALLKIVEERVKRLQAAHGTDMPIPADLITASGSGLDPHISPQAAFYQATRVAKARRMEQNAVYTLIQEHTEPPTFGLLGQARVNVLRLNLALDHAQNKGAP